MFFLGVEVVDFWIWMVGESGLDCSIFFFFRVRFCLVIFCCYRCVWYRYLVFRVVLFLFLYVFRGICFVDLIFFLDI